MFIQQWNFFRIKKLAESLYWIANLHQMERYLLTFESNFK